ncbi:hypothetical protein DCO57_17645 [Labrenzia sp. 011]|nr:hypothetical protein DCO57_17645 [Labrenzia sp. 011]
MTPGQKKSIEMSSRHLAGGIGFQSGRDIGSGCCDGSVSREGAAGGEVDWIPGRAGDDRWWVGKAEA